MQQIRKKINILQSNIIKLQNTTPWVWQNKTLNMDIILEYILGDQLSARGES